MPQKWLPIETYSVVFRREFNLGDGGKASALIVCRDSTGFRVQLVFLHPDSAPVDNIAEINEKFGRICFSSDQYLWCIDLLRNEKPVYIVLDDERPNLHNRLYTGEEPVGEGEISG